MQGNLIIQYVVVEAKIKRRVVGVCVFCLVHFVHRALSKRNRVCIVNVCVCVCMLGHKMGGTFGI